MAEIVAKYLCDFFCSHLFQRVASFLQGIDMVSRFDAFRQFSSLSESGFIPT